MKRVTLLSCLFLALAATSACADGYKTLKTIGFTSAAAVGAGLVARVAYDNYCRAHANDSQSDPGNVFVSPNGEVKQNYNCTNWHETKVQYDYSLLETGFIYKSTEKLRRSMAANGEPKAKGCDAHHIVPEKSNVDPDNELSRKILSDCGIDIDSHKNGIYLPSSSEPECEGSRHRGLHTPKYFKAVNRALKDAKRYSCDDVEDALEELKRDLRSSNLGRNGYN